MENKNEPIFWLNAQFRNQKWKHVNYHIRNFHHIFTINKYLHLPATTGIFLSLLPLAKDWQCGRLLPIGRKKNETRKYLLRVIRYKFSQNGKQGFRTVKYKYETTVLWSDHQTFSWYHDFHFIQTDTDGLAFKHLFLDTSIIQPFSCI